MCLVRALLEMRVLFEGGPYMRKYRSWNSSQLSTWAQYLPVIRNQNQGENIDVHTELHQKW